MIPETDRYDVAIVGGAFAGSAAALLLLRSHPALRVAIIEKNEKFDRKVGESAVELSSWFMTRVLGLDRHLNLVHLPKYGLRFWFHNDRVTSLSEASELGNRYQTRIPSYHIDRALLDEHVQSLAVEAGATLLRPARVVDAEIREGDFSRIEVESAGPRRSVDARWIVDATGRAAWLARRMGLYQPMPEHPTRSVWARYRNIRDFDSPWLSASGPMGKRSAGCSRGLSTNHFTGPGWWLWVIPLSGGDTSVGVVWDERIFNLPQGASLGERFDRFLASFPGGRELLLGATRVEDDLHALNGLAYSVSRLAGDGWSLVGDAAGFIDPFYSPGLDWAALCVSGTTDLVGCWLKGEGLGGAIERHNRQMTRGFRRWFEAIFRDKYYYLGDAELMEIALRIEVALYYFGVVSSPYRKGRAGLEVPFARAASEPFFRLMQSIRYSLARLGRIRMSAGTWGRKNARRQVLLPGFALGPGSLKYVPGAIARLALIEARSLPDRLRARRRRDAARLTDAPPAPIR